MERTSQNALPLVSGFRWTDVAAPLYFPILLMPETCGGICTFCCCCIERVKKCRRSSRLSASLESHFSFKIFPPFSFGGTQFNPFSPPPRREWRGGRENFQRTFSSFRQRKIFRPHFYVNPGGEERKILSPPWLKCRGLSSS